ncbi:hypothetical protein ACQP2E_17165 [Actinoplanes sp. CA-015351]|uniref:hypothetical protein n=1 Tax=Actinoplanes sp. CA-015351 TaxID=3239897 RepID=UPI003D97D4F5
MFAVPAAVTGTLGLFAVVGFSSAESRVWDSPVTIAALVAGPLLPLHDGRLRADAVHEGADGRSDRVVSSGRGGRALTAGGHGA